MAPPTRRLFTSTRGLAFSIADFNPWHPTARRSADAGHGINASFDNTRDPANEFREILAGDNDAMNPYRQSEAEGGASFAFNVEPNGGGYFTYDGSTSQYGILDSNWPMQEDFDTNPALPDTYNLLGGVFGTLTSGSFTTSQTSTSSA